MELKAKDLDYSVPLEKIHEYRKSKKTDSVIGQSRALKALQFGIGINSKGYNIFVTGDPGTGKHSTVKKVLTKYKHRRALKDVACVCNFADPDSPEILYFPKGKGIQFKEAIKGFISMARKKLRLQTENNIFRSEKGEIIKLHENTENKVLDEFESVLDKDHFALVNSTKEDADQVAEIMPIYDGKVVSFDELHDLLNQGKLTKEEWESCRSRYYRHADKFEDVLRKMQMNKTELETKIQELEKKHVAPFITSCLDKIRDEFKGKGVSDYLDAVSQDILGHLDLFFQENPEHTEAVENELTRYEVNILVDNSKTKNCPVIFENHPTYSNLFGTIEYRTELSGETKSNFMQIKSGSLIKASGGFVVINAEDLFQDEYSWDYLKRTLKSGEIQIQPQGNPLNMMGTSIKPKPVKIDVKVILIGSEKIFDVLYESDEDFSKFFKVSAEFDDQMPFNDENTRQYVSFAVDFCKKMKYKPITDDGIGYVLKYGRKLTEDRRKLSTRFSKITDLITEANYWAREMGLSEITAQALKKAEEEKKYFESLSEDRVSDMMADGTIKIQVDGLRVGAVNALTVLSRGSYSYGRPSLLTAVCSSGDDGIINIEHEAGLSGEIYDKAVMITEGFLRSRYADKYLMSFRASICFEQSYGMIEGDSASSAELYALLSAVTGVSLRQDIAATGSVNQHGDIQPVGGVSEKIIGFYTMCKRLGLTGKQGVIVPKLNIDNILLPQEIIDAVSKKRFHIYPVSSIDEGLELLTGMESNAFNTLAKKKFKELSSKTKANK